MKCAECGRDRPGYDAPIAETNDFVNAEDGRKGDDCGHCSAAWIEFFARMWEHARREGRELPRPKPPAASELQRKEPS